MTTATSKTDRIPNRAPKGGAISLVNGRFYLGGQFMPMVAEVVPARPAALVGSVRQVAWARRLRAEKLASLDARLADLLHGMDAVKKGFRPFFAFQYREAATARHRLMVEPEAGVIIDACRA